MPQSEPIRVLIADDDPLAKQVLEAFFRSKGGFTLVGHASDGIETINLVRELKPDILLLDRMMPRLPGMDTLRLLASEGLRVRTIMISGCIEKKEIAQALKLGARGILQKESLCYLEKCIQAVMDGYYWVENRSASDAMHILRDLTITGSPEPGIKGAYKLTQRELQIISLVTLGESNRAIGSILSISEDTVKRHLNNIFNKVGMSSRLELAMFALEHHLVSS
jgi:DNA-binding NarL/FixJ family response regulator